MSRARRTRERNAAPKGETYSRADEALWDDEYLLKLFNEQLENSTAVSAAAQSDEDHHSKVSSTSESDSEESASSAQSQSQISQAMKVTTQPAPMPTTASGIFSGLQLPADVEVLVKSFYNAGFEAGRYVGRSEAKGRTSRKRGRE